MKILFDQGVPVPLRAYLRDHVVTTAYELQWAALRNGELLDAAEENGFELLVTTDQNLEYQQNLQGRRIAILVLLTTAWPSIKREIQSVLDAIADIGPGELRHARFTIAPDR